jgi:hypothetical protein
VTTRFNKKWIQALADVAYNRIEVRRTHDEPSSRRTEVRRIQKHRGAQYIQVEGLWHPVHIDGVREVYYILLGEGREQWQQCP